MLRHFLGRIRHALMRSSKHKWTTLRASEKSDLHLTQAFLDEAKNGISMNILVFRKPNITLRSEASEFGLEGYNIISGNTWTIKIPPDCDIRTPLYSLEFLACVITIWIETINFRIAPESCILSQTDSTSASGWLRKSNFSDTNMKQLN